MKSASSALQSLLKGLGMDGALGLGRINARWNALFKGALSFHTHPDSIKGGLLTVNVDSPAWLHQAGFYRNEMLRKLRPFGVRSLRFRLGKVPGAERLREEAIDRPQRELTDDEKASIEEMVSGIADEQLRESIRQAVTKSASGSEKSRS